MDPAHSSRTVDIVIVRADIDLAVVDWLARVQLAARRLGWLVRVRIADDDLRALVELVGLSDALRLEPRREPE